jgi:hypothetical protein
MKQKTNTFDRTVLSLCYEIDDLKDQVEYWKTKYEAEIQENIQRTNESIENSKKGIANALMFALSVRDDENGNLVIDREDRKTLAENWK